MIADPLATHRSALAQEARVLHEKFATQNLQSLCAQARDATIAAHGTRVTYSRKVFIPLTRLCRDTCAYCTFATTPSHTPAYLTPDEILHIARAGQRAGCHEALFTLGDKPERRYQTARDALTQLGFPTTLAYLGHACALVLRETGLLPHVNAGVMGKTDIAALRAVSASQGLMLESASPRLTDRGQAHHGSPDKHPIPRIATIDAAGDLRVPFTSGILIGIGETREERIESLLILRELHRRHGHIQEVIIQNFRAKPNTRMANAPEPGLQDLLWTIAVARHILGPQMNIQAPPNLSASDYPQLLSAGINDWGGISPVTPDHVNPESPWPHLENLEQATTTAGRTLTPRLAIYPTYARDAETWLHPKLRPSVLALSDATSLARDDSWSPGTLTPPPPLPRPGRNPTLTHLLDRAATGTRLTQSQITHLFSARGPDLAQIVESANQLRIRTVGGTVRYVVVRNINYTNVCTYSCRFCAFSKGSTHDNLRGIPYDLSLEEIARRAAEAWDRGATEICMQGGINPHYTGETYLTLLRTVKAAAPNIHVHAFSPLEIAQGAATLAISVESFLLQLKNAGLGSLPGTAAEILDDPVRDQLAPNKLGTQGWLSVIETAHRVGLRTTATIMFGHIETPESWSRHLLHIRDLQEKTGGFTEFVPLPFVHMEAPIYLKGGARPGPTWRESLLIHAIARLVLHPLIPNIQASWVKLGPDGIRQMLDAGVNDLGGTLMDESISRAAGTQHGQEFPPAAMEHLIRSAGRTPQQRTTLYTNAPEERRIASLNAVPLKQKTNTPYAKKARGSVPGPRVVRSTLTRDGLDAPDPHSFAAGDTHT
jgi:FO synthase